MTFITPSRDSRWLTLRSRSSPITAMTVRSTPNSGTGCSPFAFKCSMIFSTFSFSTPLSITMIILLLVIVLIVLASIGVSLVSKGSLCCGQNL